MNQERKTIDMAPLFKTVVLDVPKGIELEVPTENLSEIVEITRGDNGLVFGYTNYAVAGNSVFLRRGSVWPNCEKLIVLYK